MQSIIDALTLAIRNTDARLYMLPLSAPDADRTALLMEYQTYRLALLDAERLATA